MSKVDELIYELQLIGAADGVKVPYKDRILDIVAMCVASKELHEKFIELIDVGIKRGIDLDV